MSWRSFIPVMIILGVLVLAAGCSIGELEDRVRKVRNVEDTAAVGLKNAPCAMSVGALLRLPSNEQAAVLELCMEINNDV